MINSFEVRAKRNIDDAFDISVLFKMKYTLLNFSIYSIKICHVYMFRIKTLARSLHLSRYASKQPTSEYRMKSKRLPSYS